MSLPTTTPHGAPGPDTPAGVADRGWPPGFRRGPVRFVLSGAAWRAVGWTVVLALVAVPLCVASVLLLPLLPVVARVADALGRAGARWTGAPVTPRGRGGWQGWQRMVLLGVLDVLGVVALGVVGGAGGLVGGGIVGAVVAVLHPGDARMTLGTGEVTWTPGIVGVALTVAVLALVVLVYLSWLLSGLSVWATTAVNAPTGRDIERLERSRAVLADAVDAERRRIERELHDGVQQYLTALQLSLGTLELALRRDAAAAGTVATGTAGDPGDPGGTGPATGTAGQTGEESPLVGPLAQAQLNARRASEALRATVRGLYPQVLRDRGLGDALRELVAHSGLDGGVEETAAPGADGSLAATPALLLYHCAAEGVTNAVRHGQARRVGLRVRYGRDAVTLTLDDDGSGLAPAGTGRVPTVPGGGDCGGGDCGGGDEGTGRAGRGAGVTPTGDDGTRSAAGPPGTGIAGLRERAAVLGGTVRVGPSRRYPGASLEMTLPRHTPLDGHGRS
ncbi:sensor histidine kinase [Corynebacterium bovis]|nr:histidine kinase [Corynebacterium bovis]